MKNKQNQHTKPESEIATVKGRTKGKTITDRLAQIAATLTCCLFAALLFAGFSARADVPSNRITYIDFNMNNGIVHSYNNERLSSYPLFQQHFSSNIKKQLQNRL